MSDEQNFIAVPVGGDSVRRPGARWIYVYSTATWVGSIQIETATPKEMADGHWSAPANLNFTASGYAEIPNGIYVRAVPTGQTNGFAELIV